MRENTDQKNSEYRHFSDSVDEDLSSGNIEFGIYKSFMILFLNLTSYLKKALCQVDLQCTEFYSNSHMVCH